MHGTTEVKDGHSTTGSGPAANQEAGRGSAGSDWLLGRPVVMMMGIRSRLRGLYPGACSLKRSKDEEAGAQRNSRKHKQI